MGSYEYGILVVGALWEDCWMAGWDIRFRFVHYASFGRYRYMDLDER